MTAGTCGSTGTAGEALRFAPGAHSWTCTGKEVARHAADTVRRRRAGLARLRTELGHCAVEVVRAVRHKRLQFAVVGLFDEQVAVVAGVALVCSRLAAAAATGARDAAASGRIERHPRVAVASAVRGAGEVVACATRLIIKCMHV